jgi:predicted ATPase
MERRYGSDPAARSHGEAFLNLFQGRVVPGGFYLLDEPEAALSPQSQIALLAIMLDMVGRDAQFLIDTPSSILLAYPQAVIYSFDQVPVSRAHYDELEQVKLTREFLRDPVRFLARLGEAQA